MSERAGCVRIGIAMTRDDQVLRAVEAFLGGDETAARDLLPHIYSELRRVARGVVGQATGATISPTVLGEAERQSPD